MKKTHIYKLLIVAALVATGIWLDLAGLLDAETLLRFARGYADHWWLTLVLILLQVLMFTFALAGSVFLWVVAPLYPPAMAAFILAAGGALGGVSAYFFSEYLTDEWIARVERSRVYRLLHKRDNFFSLFAMRIFPAFPHALVNYSSGILKVKLSHFILSALLGIYIKSYIYAKVIYSAASSASLDQLLEFSTYGPLIGLSAISALVVFVRYRLSAGRSKN